MRPEHPAAVVAPSGEVPPERVRVDEDGGLGGPALEVEVAPDLLADPVRARVAEHEVVGDIRVVVGRHDEEESPLAVSFGPGVDAELHTARRMGRRGPASCGADDGLAAGATAGSAGSVAGSVFAAGCAGLSAAIVVVIRGRVSAAAGDESERQSQVDERARHGFLRMARLRQNRTGDIGAAGLGGTRLTPVLCMRVLCYPARGIGGAHPAGRQGFWSEGERARWEGRSRGSC